MDYDTEALNAVLIALVLIAALAILLRPSIALIAIGILALIAGLIGATGTSFRLPIESVVFRDGNVLGFSPATALVGGLGLIAFGRTVGVLQSLLAEARRLRANAAGFRPPPGAAPPSGIGSRVPEIVLSQMRSRRERDQAPDV